MCRNLHLNSKSHKTFWALLVFYSSTWLQAMHLTPKLDTCLYTSWAIVPRWFCQVDLGTDWSVNTLIQLGPLGPTLLACHKAQHMLLTTYRPASLPAIDNAKPLIIIGRSIQLNSKSHKTIVWALLVFAATPGLKPGRWLQTRTPACSQLGSYCNLGSPKLIRELTGQSIP